MSSRVMEKRRSKKKSTTAFVSMTSLMDMFTIILIFLLTTSSSEVPPKESAKFVLPESSSSEPFKHRLNIQITTEEILVEGHIVAYVKDALASEEMLVQGLHQALEEEAKKSIFIAQENEEMELNREVVIQGDKTIPFSLVEKIMFTCGDIGYTNMSLAVISKGSKQ